VGTPKTIEELVSLDVLKLKGLRAIVLDEADLLLEDGKVRKGGREEALIAAKTDPAP